MTDLLATSTAEISADGRYRWWLERFAYEGADVCVFIMLNPSTADAENDDPTIRRCIRFAAREGLHGLIVVNLFTGRATDPRDLWEMADPVGPMASEAIVRAIARPGVGKIICAWGAIPKWAPERFRALHRARVAFVMNAARQHNRELFALGFTEKDHQPRHPLYVRGDLPLIPFAREAT